MNEQLRIINGDALSELRKLPEQSVQMICTSPPYFNLRSYFGGEKEIGQEPTPDKFIGNLVEIFSEVKRVLKNDGTCWIVIGDSYCSTDKWGGGKNGNTGKHSKDSAGGVPSWAIRRKRESIEGAKPKDLIGIPFMLAFALRADGWYLRSEITWCKTSAMPESVSDRPSCATEKIFLLSKNPRYFYDADAVRRPPSEAMLLQVREGYNGSALKLFAENGVQNASDVKSRIINSARKRVDQQRGHSRRHAGFNDRCDHLSKEEQIACGSNLRNFWVLGPEPTMENHFATFPTEIPRRCILAGSRPGDTILDPFAGTFTTGMVALELGRKAIGIELNPDYCRLAEQRCNVTPGFQLT